MATENLVERVRKSVWEDKLVTPGEQILVGCSGGSDSTVLLHILKDIGADCRVVHVNYGLRGVDSEGDAAFVSQLCDRLAISCTIVRPPKDWPGTSGTSLQESARSFRYQVFEDAARASGVAKVAVAHHLDDQMETVLLRLIRGSGMRGLVGMRRRRPISIDSDVELVRPLLSFTRREILEWTSTNNIDYREDRSNQNERFDRVRLRNVVIPAIVEAFGEAGARNIARSAEQAQAAFDTAVASRLDADLSDAAGTRKSRADSRGQRSTLN